MKIFKLTCITIAIPIFGFFEDIKATEIESSISWPETTQYLHALKKFLISADEAHKILSSKTRDHPDRFFDRKPVFIVGDMYFFSEPSKFDVRLQGFYVNGKTKEIEYRESALFIKVNQKKIPENAYIAVRKLD